MEVLIFLIILNLSIEGKQALSSLEAHATLLFLSTRFDELYIYDVVTAQVQLQPAGGFVSVPGGMARFSCSLQRQPISGVQWLVNGSSLQDLNLRNVSATFSNHTDTGFLRFSNLPLKYNMTRIKCSVNSSSRVIASESDILLLIQGEFCYLLYVHIRIPW